MPSILMLTSNKMTLNIKKKRVTNMVSMKFRKSHMLETPWKKIKLCIWHVIKHLQWKEVDKTYPGNAYWVLVEYFGKMFRNWKEVDNHMYETFNSTCQKWTSKDEVENLKEDIVVEKEESIMKKVMENKKIMRGNKYDNRLSTPLFR